MCLAIPMRIIKIDGNKAVAEANGVETIVDITLAPDVKIDDKVIIHAGFVIEKLDPEEAQEIEAIWDQYTATLEKGK